MSIAEQLVTDMKTAMKAHDKDTLEVVRFLRSAIQNAQIDGAGNDDASLQKLIASQVKKSNDAISEFIAAGRQDLADSEKAKINIMQKYLPAQLNDTKLEEIAKKVIADAGEAPNAGKLMGAIMKQVAGQADGARVKQMVEKLLG